ncbi:hypothetical protein M0813_11538 [Anaeramoeba flamelloides]|uniref:Uncharacterized protein n=1 Tax=Anaeramoeba flamelloides TaxID=1746091 RepID=A0ABQ8ZEJ4_9EUKA|nr:hypothetical protein M0813_11538 [Anaeramoeba flamelloides]
MQPLYTFLEQVPLPNENLNPNIFEILRNEEEGEEHMTFISDPRCEPICEEDMCFEEGMFVEDEQESSFSNCVLQELKLDSRNNNLHSQQQQQTKYSQQQLYNINMIRIFTENLEESLMVFPKHNNSHKKQQKENSNQKNTIRSEQQNKCSNKQKIFQFI